MVDSDRDRFKIEDAQLMWINFSGEPSKFKERGHRSFNVRLDKDTADRMAADGWNVRCRIPDGEDPEEYCFIEVILKYRNREGKQTKPPKVVLISQNGNKRTDLTEETIGSLDFVSMKNVDLIARAYHWDINGKQGITAYLKTMYVTIDEDDLELKYSSKSPEEIV